MLPTSPLSAALPTLQSSWGLKGGEFDLGINEVEGYRGSQFPIFGSLGIPYLLCLPVLGQFRGLQPRKIGAADWGQSSVPGLRPTAGELCPPQFTVGTAAILSPLDPSLAARCGDQDA